MNIFPLREVPLTASSNWSARCFSVSFDHSLLEAKPFAPVFGNSRCICYLVEPPFQPRPQGAFPALFLRFSLQPPPKPDHRSNTPKIFPRQSLMIENSRKRPPLIGDRDHFFSTSWGDAFIISVVFNLL